MSKRKQREKLDPYWERAELRAQAFALAEAHPKKSWAKRWHKKHAELLRQHGLISIKLPV